LARFLQKADQWECPSCEVLNQVGDTKCKSCETPNPKASADTKSSSHDKSGKKVKTDEFTFSGGAPSTGFAWNSGTESGGFSFGGTDSGTGSGFSFGTEGGFTFGSGSTDPALSFSSFEATSSSDFSTGDTKFDGNETQALSSAPSEHAELFKGKEKEASGEEGDQVRHTVTVKLYQQKLVPKKIASAAGSEAEPATETSAEGVEKELRYVESGSGELHVNVLTKDGIITSGRLVLRMDKTQRLLLNAGILPSMKPIMEDKWVRFSSVSPETLKLEHYGLKLRTKEEATALSREINEVIKLLSVKK